MKHAYLIAKQRCALVVELDIRSSDPIAAFVWEYSKGYRFVFSSLAQFEEDSHDQKATL